MRARATTTVSILRGTSTNGYADEVDEPTPIYTKIPASIIEQNRRTYLPAEGAVRVVRSTRCRLTAGTDVLKSDRILDELTNAVYVINDLNSSPGSPVHMPDIILELSRTT